MNCCLMCGKPGLTVFCVLLSPRPQALVWNLAGGYQRDASGSIEPVLRLHRNTLNAWVSVSTHQT